MKSSDTEALSSPDFTKLAKIDAAVSEAFCVSCDPGVAGLDGVSGSLMSPAILDAGLLPSLTGVTGSGFASVNSSSLGTGDVGRGTVGVESAGPCVFSFFAFFFLPMIGACIGSSALGGSSSTFEASSACFARACLSFFCWLFVTCLTGADPTLLGGGEFARDNVIDARDMLSQNFSLAGVPGRSIEAILGCREACLLADVGAIVGDPGRVSAFDCGGTRVARAWFERVADEVDNCETAVAGVRGWEGGGPLVTPALSVGALPLLIPSLAAAISSLLGRSFFSVGLND